MVQGCSSQVGLRPQASTPGLSPVPSTEAWQTCTLQKPRLEAALGAHSTLVVQGPHSLQRKALFEVAFSVACGSGPHIPWIFGPRLGLGSLFLIVLQFGRIPGTGSSLCYPGCWQVLQAFALLSRSSESLCLGLSAPEPPRDHFLAGDFWGFCWDIDKEKENLLKYNTPGDTGT